MPPDIAQINLTAHGMDVRTMAGTMAEYSTKGLHTHSHHQVLKIRSGVAMLVDGHRRQPMFGALTAFIPADFAHRSIVLGNPVAYKSLYLARDLISLPDDEIRLFFITPLESALFDRIQILTPGDLSCNFNKECLNLFLKILPGEMKRTAAIVRLPEPAGTLSEGVIQFIGKNYAGALSLKDFTRVIPYSERHLSRLFKHEMNITIFEYLRLYRILIASLALCEQDRQVTQIALETGYESLSSFYRDFQTVYGIAPKRFRSTFSSVAGGSIVPV
ncbi:helix-turn-helix transcriptional regulator [Desulfobacter curvatus]|uniref:helix-turn-helix transcriptional regulator n=1 Tax=Desulfobacter curvatus TaxID=2290 RepID=UPI0003662552|nr:AraC family transcriptional regulator [Desulfobacter curvatus]